MAETKTCQIVGCENEVPRHEWPADRRDPVVCDGCLRVRASYPHQNVEASPQAPSRRKATAAADFGDAHSADF